MNVIPPPKPISLNPFTEEDYTNLNGHLENIATAFNHLKLAQQAGFDVGKTHADLSDARDKLLKIKNVYFPGR